MELILASSSIYRKELLARLNIPFKCHSPEVDESLDSSMSLQQNVLDISKRKTQAVSKFYPKALIIASDQLCSVNNKVLGKPHNYHNAFKQLKCASGNSVVFYTGLVVYNPQLNQYFEHCDKTTVMFRELSDIEIKNYLEYEQPYDCAGSFKVESLGVSLFKEIINTDPTALIGLPLIKLSEFMRINKL